jgi:hypothetical protein
LATVLTVEPSPGALRRLDHLEHHDHAGLVREASLGSGRPMADGREGALDRIAGADMLPMLGGEVVKRQQRFPVLVQAGSGLVIFGFILGKELVEGFLCVGVPLRIQISLRSALALGCIDFGSLLSTFIVLCTQQRCCRVVPNSSSGAFQNPSAPSPMANSGGTVRPRALRSASSSRQDCALSR